MVALLTAIVLNTSLGVAFKLFPRFDVNTIYAIIFNYITCSVLGLIFYYDRFKTPSEIVASPWFKYALFLGLIFVVGFFIISKCVEHLGVAITAMMQKISMVFTVVYAVVVFSESLGYYKIAGISIALMAIIMVNYRGKRIETLQRSSFLVLLLPFGTFAVNGIIDTTMFHMKAVGDNASDEGPFSTALFTVAALVGLVWMSFLRLNKSPKIKSRDILAGLLLGIPNFFSIYTILLALNLDWGGSVIYPVFNVGVILLSSIVAILVFRESLRRINIIGLLLAIIAIFLFSMSNLN